MTFETTTALRHVPKQTRGQKKVDHILRSAEGLFAEIGFDNATTNAIASRAGVSIGSLYQFFASKEAILGAIADRYLEQTRSELSRVIDKSEDRQVDTFLTDLFEVTIKLQEQRPYFLQCLVAATPSQALAGSVNQLVDELSTHVRKLLERSTTETDPKALKLRARICVAMMGSLLPIAMQASGRERARVLSELKMVLINYLQPTLKVQGML